MQTKEESPKGEQQVQILKEFTGRLTKIQCKEGQFSGMSLYNDPLLTSKEEKVGVKLLSYSFPALPATFYEVLHSMLIDESFTGERFKDAVKNVIKTCVYPTPTIASILNWDKTVRLYTYQEMLVLHQEDPDVFNKFEKIEIPSSSAGGIQVVKWARISDYHTET